MDPYIPTVIICFANRNWNTHFTECMNKLRPHTWPAYKVTENKLNSSLPLSKVWNAKKMLTLLFWNVLGFIVSLPFLRLHRCPDNLCYKKRWSPSSNRNPISLNFEILWAKLLWTDYICGDLKEGVIFSMFPDID